MTNPNDAVGTNAGYNGRTSVNAFNDDLAVYSRGIMSGWACVPNSGLIVSVGGNGSVRDVAVAEDNTGNKTTINNISGSPIDVEIESAPGSNSRIDAIVAYVDNPPQGDPTIADNPTSCGLIAVTGTASSSPVAPTDGIIRSAITADGASGATAYYVVLATVTVASGTTDITAGDITAGVNSMIQTRNMASAATYSDYTENIAITTSDTIVSQFTIPASGKYFISVCTNLHSISSSTHSTYIAVFKNSGAIDSCYATFASGAWGNLNFSRIIEYQAGEIAKIGIRDTVGITKSVNTKVRTSIIQII